MSGSENESHGESIMPQDDAVPVLQDAVEPSVGPAQVGTGREPPEIDPALLTEIESLLTERLQALTDRLFRDVAEEIQQLLVRQVWERLLDELPHIVAEVLREQRGE